MLYRNTRNKVDSYTAHRVLNTELPTYGGLALPMNIPVLPEQTLQDVLSLSFSEAVSRILNEFFPGRITAWDIACALGKSPARLDAIGQKVLMGVLWDNREHSFEYLVNSLYGCLCGNTNLRPTRCARFAITVSVVFGLFAEASKQGFLQLDFAAAAGDMETVFAAWYAKKMGLPVGTILCVCNENSNTWDFLHRGSLNTAAPVVPSILTEMDVQLPVYLESLIYSSLGENVLAQYVAALEEGAIFSLGEEQLNLLNEGLYSCVVGSNRVADVISSVSKTDGYSLDAYAAAIYGGLQDYRAKTGRNCHTLVWASHKPG